MELQATFFFFLKCPLLLPLPPETSVKIDKQWYFTPLIAVSIWTSNYGS